MSTQESTAAQPPVGDPATGAAAGAPASLDALFEVSMPVAIEIGRTRMTVQEVLQLTAGSVIQLDRMVGEPVDVFVGDRKLAQGEVVVVGDHFGVRITRVHPAAGAETGS